MNKYGHWGTLPLPRVVCPAFFGIAVAVSFVEPLLADQPRQTTAVEVFSKNVGYPNYRIPTLLTASDGTLIALAEGRTGDDAGFGGDTDLVMRRSLDNGQTWQAMQVIEHSRDFGTKLSNPVSVLDATTGRAWVLYNRFEGDLGTTDSQPGTTNNTAWARYSDDAGANWSAAIDITAGVKDVANWNTVAFGPGSGIQARDGRLIVPSARWAQGFNSYAVYSDDHGSTWQRGDLAPGGNLSNENSLVQLADGSVLMDARSNAAGTAPRVIRTSATGGATWSAPSDGQTLASVHAANLRLSAVADGDDANRIAWTGPRGPDRENLVVRVSYDEYQSFTHERLLFDGYSGYSDLSPVGNGFTGVLLETDQARSITFTSFNRAFIEPCADLLAYEPFTYNQNTLGNKNGGLGWASGWRRDANLTNTPTVAIENSDLGFNGLPFVNEGQRRAFLRQGESMARQFEAPLPTAAGSSIYLSVLLRQDEFYLDNDLNSGESLNLSLGNALGSEISFGVTGDERYYLNDGTQAQTAANAYHKGSNFGGAGTPAWLILKISISPDGSRIFSLAAIDSGQLVPTDEAALNWALTLGGTGPFSSLDRFAVSGGNAGYWLFDELRVGTSYGAVVANTVPEPATAAMALLAISGWQCGRRKLRA